MVVSATQHPPDGSKVPRLLVVTMTLLLISFLFVTLRIYSRTRLAINLDWDDYIICLAMVRLDLALSFKLTVHQAFAFAGCVVLILCASHGLGRHVIYVPTAQIPLAAKYIFIMGPVW